MTASNGDLFQNSVYIGINIQNILYGIELLLYFKTIRILLTNRGARKKSDLFYALFSSMMMFLVTVWIITQAIFGEEMWLLQSDYPGGADAYWQQNIAVWYMDWGTTAVVILQLMTDALMIYRCWVIWSNYYVVVIPIILWVATLVLGFLVDWVTSSPGGNFFAGLASKLGLAYYTVSVFLNTILTCLVCYCMVRHARAVQRCLGHEYASSYFNVVVTIVESVLPYTLSGIAFLLSLGLGSPTSVAFVCVYFLMMCISPQMLILRVVVGRAWDKDTFKPQSSTLKFSPGATTGSQLFYAGSGEVPLKTLSKVYNPDGHDKV
ncbi:hypothetical protein J3R82DRAFT_1722 [Butyriboletus roseoflavus]|nr:hypothetical protein J3R82DRAFT_1722 [Butyriboletus roseoflavus]